jgi:heme/copper-type cytochrome/quinol oxidase subunit 2
MDVPLYAIALALFAVLYLAIGVFLAFTLLITLFIMFAYLVVRYRDLPANYPHSAADAATTMIFIGITWAIFTFVADKNPVPFIGAGLTYTSQALIPLNAIIGIAFVVSIVFLLIFAFIASRNRDGEAPEGESAGNRPKQGVGA